MDIRRLEASMSYSMFYKQYETLKVKDEKEKSVEPVFKSKKKHKSFDQKR